MGAYLGSRLKKLAEAHSSVGDVRGIGLFWAVELVRDRATRAPFNTPREKYDAKPLLIDQVTGDMMKRGVYCMGWVSHLILAPPLIITREELDSAIAALDESLKIADRAAAG
jgi:taurine--2-oxoglutarate transaminase